MQRNSQIERIVSDAQRDAVDRLTASLVDANNAAPPGLKRCTACGKTAATRKRKCDECGTALLRADEARQHSAEAARRALAPIENSSTPIQWHDITPKYIP